MWIFWIAAAILCLFCLWLWMIAPRHPRSGMKKLTETNRYFAHRGLHDEDIPENTLPAFARAVEHGYGIELDVQITSDGVAVIFHDDTLNRMLGVDGHVHDLTYADLRALPVAGKPDFSVPTFSEVLQTVAGRVPMIVEIKATLPEWHETLSAAVALLDEYEGPFCVESFNPLVLRWLARHRPAILRGQLSAMYRSVGLHRTFATRVSEQFLTNVIARPDFIAYNIKNDHSFPFRAVTRFFPECTYAAWTPRSPEEEAKGSKAFDIMIFENYLPTEPRGRAGIPTTDEGR